MNENATQVYSPLKGDQIPLSEVPDNVFANEIMGRTIVIEPQIGEIYAPFDGEIVTVFPTHHAFGLRDDKGAELLIHIGIDTVELDGKGFEVNVHAGDKVEKGELLGHFDINSIKQSGYSLSSAIVITNTDQFTDVINTNKKDNLSNDEVLFTVFN